MHKRVFENDLHTTQRRRHTREPDDLHAGRSPANYTHKKEHTAKYKGSSGPHAQEGAHREIGGSSGTTRTRRSTLRDTRAPADHTHKKEHTARYEAPAELHAQDGAHREIRGLQRTTRTRRGTPRAHREIQCSSEQHAQVGAHHEVRHFDTPASYTHEKKHTQEGLQLTTRTRRRSITSDRTVLKRTTGRRVIIERLATDVTRHDENKKTSTNTNKTNVRRQGGMTRREACNHFVFKKPRGHREMTPGQDDETPDRKNSGKNSYIQLQAFCFKLKLKASLRSCVRSFVRGRI
jgi:hypothetical protein